MAFLPLLGAAGGMGQNFNGGGLPAGWSTTGLWGITSLCAATAPGCSSGSFAYYGQTQSGTCNYNTDDTQNSGTLTSVPFLLPAGQTITFSYCSRRECESGTSYDDDDESGTSYDQCFVKIGPSLIQLEQVFTNNGEWETRTLDLSPYAGQSIELVFEFNTVDAQFNDFLGWQIDNILVTDTRSGATADPHLVGANGAAFDFDGELDAAYALFSAPQFQVNMHIAGDGPKPHFMTEVGLLFRDESFLFTVVTMDDAFRDALQAKLNRAGGRLMKFKPWQVMLELCPGHRVTITQKHTTETEKELWHADGRPFYYLDVEVAVPDCNDAYNGALGQMYQCKYVQDGEAFAWSPEQEETFRLPEGLLSPSGAFAAGAPCVDSKGAAGQESKEKKTGKKRSWRGQTGKGAEAESLTGSSS